MSVRHGSRHLIMTALLTALAMASGCAAPGSVTGPGGGEGGSVSAKHNGKTTDGKAKNTGGGNAMNLLPGSDDGTSGSSGGGPGASGSFANLPLVNGGLAPTTTGIGAEGPGLTALNEPPPQRIVEQSLGIAASLIGKVKLISDKGGQIVNNAGARVISNNAASLIGDAGSSLIGDAGSSLIGDAGSSLIGKTKYRVAQVVAEEVSLSEAWVEVFDAAGNRLVLPDGKPIASRTDAQGNYKLAANLPNENLVLRIRLADDVAKGGELRAMITKLAPSGGEVHVGYRLNQTASREVDIDTTSTFGATYVLDKFVKGSQPVYERLPFNENDTLNKDMAAARGTAITGAPSYKPADSLVAVDALRGTNTTLDTTLVRIEKLLTLGQSNLGEGLPATEVALGSVTAVAGGTDGSLYIADSLSGRVRKVDGTGKIYNYVEPVRGLIKNSFGAIDDMAVGPDGLLYAVEPKNRQVRRASGRELQLVAGNGGVPNAEVAGFVDANGQLAPEATIKPNCLAFASDGTLYLGEPDTMQGDPWGTPGRLFKRKQDARLERIGNSEPVWFDRGCRGLAVTKEGSLWAIASPRAPGGPALTVTGGVLLRKAAGSSTWAQVSTEFNTGGQAAVCALPDGSVAVSEDKAHKVWKVTSAGQRILLAGTGTVGFSGDGGPGVSAQLNVPSGLWASSAGAVYVADLGNSLVRMISPSGTITTVAGTTGGAQTGDASKISINRPAGVAMDADGNLIFTENGSHTVKRFDGTNFSLLAGTGLGFSGDGGPATAAQLSEPTGMAIVGDKLYVGDFGNYRLRAIDLASGTMSTVAGIGKGNTPVMASTPFSTQTDIGQPSGLAIDKQGNLVFASMSHQRVVRLKGGQLELVAGKLSTEAVPVPKPGSGGDGAAATNAGLSSPMGLAYDASGNLYIADVANLRVRKVNTSGTISTVAGKFVDVDALIANPVLAFGNSTIQALLNGNVPAFNGQAASEAILTFPISVAIAADGRLYIGECGGKNLSNLATRPELPGITVSQNIPARIRRLEADGKLTLIAGPNGKVLNGTDGEESLGLPISMLFDQQGRLVVVDAANNQVRIIPASSL